MKIEILQENLYQALTIVSRFTSVSGQLPILSAVLINASQEGVVFSATNLELSVNYWIGAKVATEGKVVVPAKQLLEAVSFFPKEKITISVEEGGKGNRILISGKTMKTRLNILPKEEFPHIPTVREKTASVQPIEFETGQLKNGIEHVLPAASHDEARAVLTGVKISFQKNQIELAATDGYRLSLYRIKGETKGILTQPIIVPGRALAELIRLIGGTEGKATLTLSAKENQAVFVVGGGEIIVRLIEGEFPDYAKIIPSAPAEEVSIDREEMDRAVKMTAVFAREAASIVQLLLSKQELQVKADAPQIGEGVSRIAVNYSGEEKRIAFNGRFLSDLVRCIQGKEIVMRIQDGLKPGVFTEKGDDRFLHLIMPVRTQENK